MSLLKWLRCSEDESLAFTCFTVTSDESFHLLINIQVLHRTVKGDVPPEVPVRFSKER